MTGSTRDRLSAELWPAGHLASAGPPLPGYATHGVVQASGASTVLPIGDRRACADAMVRWTDATTIKEVAARAMARIGMRAGAVRLLPMEKVQVKTQSADGEAPTLHEYLAEALDVPRLALSCNLGSRRPNQKAIVRAHGPGGETIGFAKVGWNELTTSLVATESTFLELPQVRAETRIRVPRLIHAGWWNDRYISVASPLMGSARLTRPEVPNAALTETVAGLSPVTETTISESILRRALDRRIQALDPDARREAEHTLHSIDGRYGHQRLRFGRWHGDWAPWNLSTTGSTPIVWDWERTAPDTPIGFDPLHWAFHSRLAAATSPLEALISGVESVGEILGALGVQETSVRPLVMLYALEMHIRFGSGTDGSPEVPGRPGWVDGLLTGVTAWGSR